MKIFIGLLFLIIASAINADTIYKYQDEKGRWHFTDKPPNKIQAETLKYKSAEAASPHVRVYLSRDDNQINLLAENSLWAPVQVSIKSSKEAKESSDWVVPAKSTQLLKSSQEAIPPFVWAWTLGDPNKSSKTQEYAWPMDKSLCPHVTQGFFGRFSHKDPYNRYAIDIGANVGTSVMAARDGVVIGVKDDYALGGVDNFFMDKANFVQVYHDDGTWAIYAHILLGSAEVKLGDQVKVGDLLAKSGSSGYSSGPHLHFVIQRNQGLKVESIPFVIKTTKGNLAPGVGQKLCDY
jgi:murein DD-endopeptidase MepM/ murein hydrolase activator NlpD